MKIKVFLSIGYIGIGTLAFGQSYNMHQQHMRNMSYTNNANAMFSQMDRSLQSLRNAGATIYLSSEYKLKKAQEKVEHLDKKYKKEEAELEKLKAELKALKNTNTAEKSSITKTERKIKRSEKRMKDIHQNMSFYSIQTAQLSEEVRKNKEIYEEAQKRRLLKQQRRKS